MLIGSDKVLRLKQKTFYSEVSMTTATTKHVISALIYQISHDF